MNGYNASSSSSRGKPRSRLHKLPCYCINNSQDVTKVAPGILYINQIFTNITYGVVFVQFHWLNQSRDIQNI